MTYAKRSLILLLSVAAAVSLAETTSITHTVRQPFAGSQSPDDARMSALAKAKREALEKTGTYLESFTVVKNSMLERDEIIALAAGIVRAEILSQKNYASDDAFGIEVVVQVEVDNEVLEQRVRKMLDDRELLAKYEQSVKRESELLERIRRLERQNMALLETAEDKGELKEELKTAARALSAVEYHRKALALWKDGWYTDVDKVSEYLRLAKEADPEYATIYWSLGLVAEQKNRPAAAVTEYKNALALYRERGESELPEVGILHIQLGNAYQNLKQYASSLAAYEQAIEILADAGGEYATLVGDASVNMGNTYAAKRDYRAALRYYARAREVFAQREDVDDIRPYSVSFNMGVTYYEQHQLNEALQCLLDAEPGYVKHLGESNPRVALLYNNIGLAYFKKGRRADAKKYLRKGYEIYVETLGANHAATLNCLKTLRLVR